MKIELNGLRVAGRHGVYPEEREQSRARGRRLLREDHRPFDGLASRRIQNPQGRRGHAAGRGRNQDEPAREAGDRCRAQPIDAARLDHYHQLERARIQLALLDEVDKGLADVRAARTSDARAALRRLRRKRAR